jgi:hypothetical protein
MTMTTTTTTTTPVTTDAKDKYWEETRVRNQIQQFSDLAKEFDHGVTKLRERIWTHQTNPSDQPDLPRIMLKAITRSNNLEGFDLLVEEELISKEMKKSVEPIVDAIVYNQSQILKTLINYGFNVSDPYDGSVWRKGMKPLEIAARYGSSGMIRTLLLAGAKPDTDGFTDLCEAAYHEREQTALIILNEYKYSLLQKISKGEIIPFNTTKEKSPETLKRWGRIDLPKTQRLVSSLIKTLSVKLLKEKEMSRTLDKIRKTETEIGI